MPRLEPTSSYWQHIPHALANVRSASLPEATDIVVIGSGITGASVTKRLLDKDAYSNVVVFEARSLCSGATGRNGGQLATNAGEVYRELKERFGSEQAGKIAAFTLKTCDRMEEIIAEYALEESEYRKVLKVRTFLDDDSFTAMKDSISQMETDHPGFRGIYDILNAETVRKVSGIGFLIGFLTDSYQGAWGTRSNRRGYSPGRSNVAIPCGGQGI